MATLEVTLPAEPARAYSITIRAGSLARLPARLVRLAAGRRVALVSDSRVAALYGRSLKEQLAARVSGVRLFRFPAGERSKTRKTKARIEDALLGAGYGRDSLIVAVGGGVVGDLAGFVAATFERGVAYVQVPTTLLAMVDSSVGGKTGLDTRRGKNLIGAFWQPLAVVVDPSVLATLPPRQVRAGAAEVAKHGVIAEARLFAYVEKNLDALLGARPSVVARVVAESCRVKAAVVGRDEREGGYRQILNFGHTIAHGLELVSGYRLLHGEAVWVGLAVEALLAHELGLLGKADAGRICNLAGRAYPVSRALEGVTGRALLAAAARDKKSRKGVIRYALPERLGAMHAAGGRWSRSAPAPAVRAALARAREIGKR